MEKHGEPLNARDRIKHAALKLFAERGIDGVSVREITRLAGQKNQGSLNYYFGLKENLVRELVVDGAKIMDIRRNQALDQLEASGVPLSVRQITDILVFPATGVTAPGSVEGEDYNRFLFLLELSHRRVFMEALDDQWNSGYQRCLDHLRRLMPPMTEAEKNQRFIFIGAYLGSVLAKREHALTGPRPGIWTAEDTLNHFSQTIVAILTAPATMQVSDMAR